MEIREITPQEKPAMMRLQSVAFLYPVDIHAEEKRAREHPETIDCRDQWGCFDEHGALIAGLANWPSGMYYDGHVVQVGGIGGVASHPEHRVRGNIRAIFSHVLADDRARGVLFSILYPFSHSYYRQFGYELCREGQILRFPTQALAPFRQDVQARMADPEGDRLALEAMYGQYASAFTYALARGERSWKQLLRGTPYEKDGPHRYIISRDGQDVAYCMFRPVREADRTNVLQVFDFAYLDVDALRRLLAFLHRLSAQFATVELEAPDGFPLSSLLAEAYDVKVHGQVRTMARALHVGEALRLMRHPSAPGGYRIRVEDAFLPDNTGVYDVIYCDGAVRVTQTPDGEADVEMTVQTFTQLCLGFLPIDAASLKPDVRIHGNLDTLRQVFVRKNAFLADRF